MSLEVQFHQSLSACEKQFFIRFLSGIMPIEVLKKSQLVEPYDYLLTQTLMTLGLERHYQQATAIETVSESYNHDTQRYARTIKMLVDDQKVVEYARILVNTTNVPTTLIQNMLSTSIPFGKLLARERIEVTHANTQFFSGQAGFDFVHSFGCEAKIELFGRVNTLVNKKNGEWIAQIVEVLNSI